MKVYALDDDVCLGDQTKAYAIDNELEVVACGRVPELELGRSVCCTALASVPSDTIQEGQVELIQTIFKAVEVLDARNLRQNLEDVGHAVAIGVYPGSSDKVDRSTDHVIETDQ